MTHAPDNACECPVCRRACERKPGWFMPGEAEALAERMGLSLEELFRGHLMVDWWAGSGRAGDETPDDIYVLSPAIAGEQPGTVFGFIPLGTCQWLRESKCAVHDLGKPQECRGMHHDPVRQTGPDHREIALAWNKPEHQSLIARLLGEEPSNEAADLESLVELALDFLKEKDARK